jgi:hypothetical protein
LRSKKPRESSPERRLALKMVAVRLREGRDQSRARVAGDATGFTGDGDRERRCLADAAAVRLAALRKVRSRRAGKQAPAASAEAPARFAVIEPVLRSASTKAIARRRFDRWAGSYERPGVETWAEVTHTRFSARRRVSITRSRGVRSQ